MARPNIVPTYATDATLTGGPQTGLATRLQPPDALRAQGVYADRRLPARVFAWILGMSGDWLKYFDLKTFQDQASNWTSAIAQGTASAVNTQIGAAWLDLGTSGGTWVVLDVAHTLYTQHDPLRGTWNAAATLSAGNPTRPNVASGILDGVPAFLATGTAGNNNFYTSIDGTSWTTRNVVTGIEDRVPVYCAANNRWVGVGGAVNGTLSPMYSTATAAAIVNPWTVAASSGTWFVIGNSGGAKRVVCNGLPIGALPLRAFDRFAVSTDGGTTWSTTSAISNQLWKGLAYSASEGLWMAISDGGHVATSTDGQTWTNVGATDVSPAADLAVNGPLWVITTRNGSYGGIAYSLDRGATWVPVAAGDHSVATSGFQRIVYGDKRFIAFHVYGTSLEIAVTPRSVM